MHVFSRFSRAFLLSAVFLLVGAVPAGAQSLTVESNATFKVERDVDVDGDFTYDGAVEFGANGVLRVSGAFTKNGGTLTPNGRPVVLDGSSQQSVGGGSIGFADLELDNSNGAALNSGVDVSGTLTLTNGALTTNTNLTLTSTSETVAAAIAGSGNGSVSGHVTFERFLDKSDEASHFRALAAPTTTKLDDEGSAGNTVNLLSNMWTQSTGSGADAQVGSGSNASVFDYNEGADLNGSALSTAWEDVQNLDTNLSPGGGVLAFLFDDRDPDDGTTEGFPATLTATGAVQGAENDGTAVSPSMSFTGNDSQSEDGWNLIANPFMAPIDWESIENDGGDLTNVDATIYVWDPENNDYATYTADGSGMSGTTGGSGTQGRYVAPFQAFFVKANASNPDVGGIDASDKAVGQSPAFKSKPPEDAKPSITLELRTEDGSRSETTALRYGGEAAPGKDIYDAYQLTPLSTSYALVATEMAGADALFDHQNRPVPAAQDTVDLAFDVTERGTYVLGASSLAGLTADWKVILKDLESGARYDLGSGETVAFEHAASPSTKGGQSSAIETMLREGHPTVAKAGNAGDLPSFRLFVGPEAALPVELASFDATEKEREVRLTWQTASEQNNAGFAVERRVGAGEQGGVGERGKGGEGGWTRIGFAESKASGGTSSEPKRYRFTDADVPFEAEEVTYRLRQEDLDGTTSLSDETTLQLAAPSKTKLHVPFPNPAQGQVTLHYQVPKAQKVQIAVYDVLGRRVRTLASGQAQAGRHEAVISTTALAPGTYFVRMQAEGHAKTRRLTVVR